MDEHSRTEMEATERDEFLGVGGTGVISFSTAERSPPYSLPVSYGYDAIEETFYFRLASESDSGKGDIVDRPVTFVTHSQDDDDQWKSVVAKGTLESVEMDGISTQTLDGLQRVEIPMFDMFEEPARLVSFEFVRLVPDELTARKEIAIQN